MLFRPNLSLWLLFSLALMWMSSLDGQEPDHFIIGFERFGRHQDLAPNDAGTLLISELNCTACHSSKSSLLSPKRGPRLSGAGNRLRDHWVRQFIREPHLTHGGTTMPEVMQGMDAKQKDAVVAAIAALLTSQVEPFPALKAGGALPVIHEFWRKGEADHGRELYHTIGCVACHEPDPDYAPPSSIPSAIDALIEQLEPEELEEMGLARAARRVESIPHSDLSAKYSRRSLTMMLMDPSSVRPDARMPSLRLQPAEAADLAAYLMEDGDVISDLEASSSLARESTSEGAIEAGRRFFSELRCANCHDIDKPIEVRLAKPLDELNPNATSSCLQDPGPGMPRYRLDAAQRDAIMATLGSQDVNAKPLASQIVAHRMLQLNCYGCHERMRSEDEIVLGGVGRFRKPYFETSGKIDLGDEGRLPPPLTGVGRKLLPKALESVFEEKSAPRRPFMTIRMPAYHRSAVDELIQQLPLADEADPAKEAAVFGDADGLAEVGRELVNTGCVECHAFRGESLPGAVGIDLHGIASRVHPSWFLDFVRDPGGIKARTRMPTFFPDGQSNRKDLLQGNVERQIAAIWYYLKKTEPLPEKISEAMAKDFELVPTDRPIILRTFMHGAGTHAIAVGYPAKLNLAFDAEQVRLATGWKGRFLDARGTWFERFAPPAEPLGEQVIAFPAGPSLTLQTDTEARRVEPQQRRPSPSIRFGGYRIDNEGIPTFLYKLGPWNVEDRIEAIEGQGDQPATFQRTWSIRHEDRRVNRNSGTVAPSGLLFRAHAGQQLKRQDAATMTSKEGLTVSILSERDAPGEIIRDGSRDHWLIPLTNEPEQTIQVEYRW